MFKIYYRNEDGNNWLEERWHNFHCWTSDRHEAKVFYCQAYAEKIAAMLDEHHSRDEIRSRVMVWRMK